MGATKLTALPIGLFIKERAINVAVITALLHANQALKQNIAKRGHRSVSVTR